VLKPILLRGYLARPEEIDIEVTSSCDADCIMCPRRAMRRNPGPMPMPLFRKIVDEAIALGVRDLVLNGYGEIATLRNYRDYLAYIRERSRSVRILVNTNGMRMDEELAAAFIKYGVDVVNVAVDGATAETFERIRKHLKLETVEANVHRLLAMRKAARRNRPFVMVHMILQPENGHETELFLAKWTGVADHAGFAGMLSRAGAIPVQIRNRPSQKFPCFLLWRQMPVLSDGTVAMCCDDWDGRAALGNLNTHSIREVWRDSQQRQAARTLHLQGRRDEIDLCAGCEAPRRPPWWFPAQS
jgi:MoaA/NifB/PqqE/SkfB family radical SAM enzyme